MREIKICVRFLHLFLIIYTIVKRFSNFITSKQYQNSCISSKKYKNKKHKWKEKTKIKNIYVKIHFLSCPHCFRQFSYPILYLKSKRTVLLELSLASSSRLSDDSGSTNIEQMTSGKGLVFISMLASWSWSFISFPVSTPSAGKE